MSSEQNITQQIVEKATRKAQSAQAALITQEMSEVNFENDRLKSAESSQRTDIQVRVILDGKVGVSSTTDLNDVDGVVGRALEAAEFGSPAHYDMPPAQPLKPVKIYDPALLPLAKPEMIQLGQSMMDMIKSYNPEILAGAGLNKTIQKVQFANSAGAAYSEEHTNFDVGAGGQLVRGTDILFAGHSLAQKNRQIDTEDVAERAVEYFRLAERLAPIQTDEMPVIFTPGGLVALLLSLGLGLDGKNVLLGSSPLAGKLGQTIADPRFTIVDDPWVDYGPRTGAFDDEGVVRQPLPLIENGVLRNFVYDLDTAGRVGAKPTGHGRTRRYNNLIISPGDTPYSEMLRGIKQGLLVHEYLGLGQGNPINGEFSANVFLGYKIENGELVGRVKDVMLAGNAYNALKDIVAISQEREWVSGAYAYAAGLMPYVQVGKLSVVAK
ncbi:MAG: TldD/PmbA family protein [Anaerolineales bacterium]|nr:TldD/PmbA family protein [Anaerolineales bacterium]